MRTSTQKRWGMARVVKKSHSFTYTATHLCVNGMNHAFAFPVEAGHYFTDAGGTEGGVDLAPVVTFYPYNLPPPLRIKSSIQVLTVPDVA